MSTKKLLKGDVDWETCKVILGWVIDTVALTLMLPPHQVAKVLQLLALPSTLQHIRTSEWHQLLGILRSFSLALPSITRPLWSHFLITRMTAPPIRSICLSKLCHTPHPGCVQYLGSDLISWPTHLHEIIPTPDVILGATDAPGQPIYMKSSLPLT